MDGSLVGWLSLVAVLVSLVSNVVCVVGVLYVKSVTAPLRARLNEHERRLDQHQGDTTRLWERTSEQGERIATLEG